MRTRVGVATCGVILLAGCAAGPNPVTDAAAEEAAIRARSVATVEAENAMDFDRVVTFFEENAAFQMANAPEIRGRAAIRKLYDDFQAMGVTGIESTIADVQVAASGDLAFERGVNHLRIQTPGGEVTDVGKYLIVWRKTDGVWSIAALAASSDAPPPQPPAAAAPAS